MATPNTSFQYPPSLQKYMVPEKRFLEQHPQFDILCSGAVVFNAQGKLLLVQRAKEEHAFPNFWEIPGGKVDDTDETILHAVARELKEEAGLEVTNFVREVGQFGFGEYSKRLQRDVVWQKLIFEVEVQSMEKIVLDPIEHQDHLFATEEEVKNDRAGSVQLAWITPPNKDMNLQAFRLRREAQTTSDPTS